MLDPVDEAHQFEVPVEPPARVFLPEEDHQDGGQDDQRPARVDVGAAGFAAEGGLGEQRGDDRDRDHREDPEEGGEAVQVSVRIVDREFDRVLEGLHDWSSL